MSRGTALVLAGHGSHISAQTAGLVWRYVDQLRAWGAADEITACFWKEPPALSHVLTSLQAENIIIVPLFTAQGYFSRTLIPLEMDLKGRQTQLEGRSIYYAPTLGEHPYMTAILQERVMRLLKSEQLDPQAVTVAVIGHGTPLNPQSRDATRQQADALRAKLDVAEILAVYLDDEPNIPSIYDDAPTPIIIALPFFLASGSHVSYDVPHALGIDPENQPAYVRGRTLYYAPPIGTDATICQLILDLAELDPSTLNAPSSVWAGFPKVGAAELIEAVQEAKILHFGGLALSLENVQPIGAQAPLKNFDTPAALREHLRENPFRPLPTRADLPQDWQVKLSDSAMLPAVVETVYPGALADWANWRAGQFQTTSFESVCERQPGMFADLHRRSSSAQIAAAVEAVCGDCVRQPTWYEAPSKRQKAELIPCQSPCNLWLSRLNQKESLLEERA